MSADKTVHLVSLGCPKNRVDSEVMLGHLAQKGYAAVPNPEDADVIVVNTCGFIDAAKEESVNTILDMGDYKAKGRAKKLIVAGCLSQRYAPELAEEIPEVDHFLGTGNFDEIGQFVSGKTRQRSALPIVGQASVSGEGHRREHGNHAVHPRLVGRNKLVPYRHGLKDGGSKDIYIPDPDFSLTSTSPRLSTTPRFTTYMKISEGCSNTCSFCIIPKLRGPQRSRSIEDILQEFDENLDAGTVEFNLIAQDLCAYGKDRPERASLAQLLRALENRARRAERDVWIRCLYAYPRGLTKEVMEVMANAEHIIHYLDMPLQHINDSMLRRMKRGKGGESTKDILRKLRKRVPNITVRTTFITGMPGETEDDFNELYDFCQEFRFERMGVFTYSREKDTPAAEMTNQVPTEIAEERRDRLMQLQAGISEEQQEAHLGQEIEVLVEGVSDETDLLLQGRHKGQAPDIDGLTYITEGTASPGEVVRIEVQQAGEYDLAGPIVSA